MKISHQIRVEISTSHQIVTKKSDTDYGES